MVKTRKRKRECDDLVLDDEDQRSTISCLSDELMLMIFQQLDFRSLTHLARTCSRFARIARDKYLSQEIVVVLEGFR